MVKILLADVVYERISPSPLVVPAAIGGIATYAKKNSRYNLEVQIVHTIDQFLGAISSDTFDIAGFSYYCWNARLSGLLSSKLKDCQPDCAIVFGGPNLPIDPKLQEAVVREHTQVDLFVEKEGEVAFTRCVDALISHDFNLDAVKALGLPSVRSVLDGRFLSSPLEDRLIDLDDIPSPYLNGLMDEFLEAGFTPIIENNRGCPFSCEFCGEGDRYYSKVARHSDDRLFAEYNYLGPKMKSLHHLPFSRHLYFTDSNAGMYRQDIHIARHLRSAQEKYGWPQIISASTGKNAKERTIEVANLLNGALTMTASVQSTDPEVLKNIRRSNVSIDALKAVATTNHVEHDTYSEIILGLPGDTYDRHLKSIQDMMDCHISQLSIVQLIMLPDTPMLSPSYIAHYGLDVRYRILVKGMARVEIQGKFRTVTEIEAICVGNQNMPFEDYVRCRVVDILVAIFYNKVLSSRTFSFFEEAGKSPFDYLKALIDMEKPIAFGELLEKFAAALKAELFDDPAEIEDMLEREETYELVRAGQIGVNLTSHYMNKAISMPKTLIGMAASAAESVGGETLKDLIAKDLRQMNWKHESGLQNHRLVNESVPETNLFAGGVVR